MTASPDDTLSMLGTATQPEAPQPVPELPPGVELPYVAHCVASDTGVMVCGQILSYGDEIEVTQALVNREGAAAIRAVELTEAPAAQRALFGSIRLLPGAWPAGVDRVLVGSRQWEMRRSAAYQAADRVADEHARDRALEGARLRFGARTGPPAPRAPVYGEVGYEGPEQ